MLRCSLCRRLTPCASQSTQAPGASEFEADLVFANPTPGVLEVEPAMNWGPASLAGVGIVRDPAKLYQVRHRCRTLLLTALCALRLGER